MKISYLILALCIIRSNLYPNYDIFHHNIRYKSVSEKALDGYIDIIHQYTEALTDDNYIELVVNTELIKEPLNTYLLRDFNRFNRYREFGIYYALGDIDKNGIPELFIGGSYVTEEPLLYDIFVYDKTKGNVIRPFDEIYIDYEGNPVEFGNRDSIYYLHNGIIELAWTESGSNDGMDFYRLSPDGYSMELTDSLSVALRYTLTGDGRMVTKYFHDKEGTIEITEDEFYSIMDGYWGERPDHLYCGVSPEPLSWIQIKP